jgi:hypothetical protein
MPPIGGLAGILAKTKVRHPLLDNGNNKLPTHTTVSLLRMIKDVFERRGFYDAWAWGL